MFANTELFFVKLGKYNLRFRSVSINTLHITHKNKFVFKVLAALL